MAVRTTLTDEMAEGASAKLTATITEEDGVTGFLPSALTLTLFTEEDGAIVNGVSAVDILNTGRGTVSAGGALVCNLTPADMVIVNPRAGKADEVHVALFEWTWDGGNKKGKHEVAFTVTDLSKVS
jgi:hypothetical protein